MVRLHRIAGWKKHPASSSNCRKSGNSGKPHVECDAKRRAGSPQARMFISYSEVSIKNPDNSGRRSRSRMSVAGSRQRTEPAGSADVRKSGECRRCATYRQPYERRWLIEEYHKAWKSGGTCWNRCECRPGVTLSAWWLSRRYRGTGAGPAAGRYQ